MSTGTVHSRQRPRSSTDNYFSCEQNVPDNIKILPGGSSPTVMYYGSDNWVGGLAPGNEIFTDPYNLDFCDERFPDAFDSETIGLLDPYPAFSLSPARQILDDRPGPSPVFRGSPSGMTKFHPLSEASALGQVEPEYSPEIDTALPQNEVSELRLEGRAKGMNMCQSTDGATPYSQVFDPRMCTYEVNRCCGYRTSADNANYKGRAQALKTAYPTLESFQEVPRGHPHRRLSAGRQNTYRWALRVLLTNYRDMSACVPVLKQ
ncbi:hypothetical protein TWF192_011265 [Orbilia oligospora]|uniref:Uncharacterized protein n=1 Tax=Orbilia oligospora TaxID=2813651 RepID=A0A6G1LZ37_ORBOL|nr:hypothetical protein TWF191_008713 [Orbilia oligospora]KAF3236943.1 hypothetical protein TWF192_011265 [Orbilia oligospora]